MKSELGLNSNVSDLWERRHRDDKVDSESEQEKETTSNHRMKKNLHAQPTWIHLTQTQEPGQSFPEEHLRGPNGQVLIPSESLSTRKGSTRLLAETARSCYSNTVCLLHLGRETTDSSPRQSVCSRQRKTQHETEPKLGRSISIISNTPSACWH